GRGETLRASATYGRRLTLAPGADWAGRHDDLDRAGRAVTANDAREDSPVARDDAPTPQGPGAEGPIAGEAKTALHACEDSPRRVPKGGFSLCNDIRMTRKLSHSSAESGKVGARMTRSPPKAGISKREALPKRNRHVQIRISEDERVAFR